MVTAPAIIHAKYDHLDFDFRKKTQLPYNPGGSDPAQLKHCAKLAEERGYHEINLNVGCPSIACKMVCLVPLMAKKQI